MRKARSLMPGDGCFYTMDDIGVQCFDVAAEFGAATKMPHGTIACTIALAQLRAMVKLWFEALQYGRDSAFWFDR